MVGGTGGDLLLMLLSMTFKNLVTISDASMEFTSGLNVITGETGSGKSVLVDGLKLAVGARADKTLVRPGAKTASVEAVFQLPNGSETVIRRELGAQGRSRIFIDDTLSTLEEVRTTVHGYITIHSQRFTPVLLKPSRQLDILDTFAGSFPLRKKYEKVFLQWKENILRVKKLDSFLLESETSRDLISHEITLFNEINPSIDDYTALVDLRFSIKKNVEQSSLLQETYEALFSDDGISTVLSGILRKLQREFSGKEELTELISQASIAVEEAVNLLASDISDLEEAPVKVQKIDSRLDDYSDLINRCGGTVELMLEYRENLWKKLEAFTDARLERDELVLLQPALAEEVLKNANKLTVKRKKAAKRLAKLSVAEMVQLNMPHAQFSIKLNPPESLIEIEGKPLDSTGAESALFLFSANRGIPEDSLEVVASGGELSRVSLALALVVADSADSSTLVFDEIDAGTGGETAHNLAESLLRAAKSRQIIVISHLAQIASRGHRHLAVTKNYSDGMPVTSISTLDSYEDQLIELARLLGGGAGAEIHAAKLLEFYND